MGFIFVALILLRISWFWFNQSSCVCNSVHNLIVRPVLIILPCSN